MLPCLRDFIIITIKAGWYKTLFRVFPPFSELFFLIVFLLRDYKCTRSLFAFHFIWSLPSPEMLSLAMILCTTPYRHSPLGHVTCNAVSASGSLSSKWKISLPVNFYPLFVSSLSEWNCGESGSNFRNCYDEGLEILDVCLNFFFSSSFFSPSPPPSSLRLSYIIPWLQFPLPLLGILF